MSNFLLDLLFGKPKSKPRQTSTRHTPVTQPKKVLSKEEQAKLNGDLYDLLGSNKPGHLILRGVEKLLEQGADPLAYIEFPDGDKRLIFISVLRLGADAILKIVLNHLKDTDKKLDLAKRFNVQPTIEMNIFQFAALDTGKSCLEELYKYAKDTGQSEKIADILNADIKYTSKDDASAWCEHLAVVLARTYSNGTMVGNFKSTKKSDSAEAERVIPYWQMCAKEADLPKQIGRIGFTFSGAAINQDYLMSLGMNPNPPYGKTRLLNLLQDIDAASKDLSKFPQLIKLLKLKGVEVVKGSEHMENGRVVFDAMVKNKKGKFPIKVTTTVDVSFAITAVLKHIDRHEKMAEEATKAQAIMAPMFAEHKAMKKRVDGLSELELEDVQASLAGEPAALHCFNVLQRAIYAFLFAPALQKTKMFATKPSADVEMLVGTTQALLNVAGQGLPVPFLGIVTSVASGVVSQVEKRHTSKVGGGILSATEGCNIVKLATKIAALITARLADTYGAAINDTHIEMLTSNVSKQLNKLHKAQFRNPAELILYVFAGSTEFLPAARQHSGDKLSQGSGSITMLSSGDSDHHEFTPGYTATLKDVGVVEMPRRSRFGLCM